MALAAFNYTLSDNCPIAWPTATPLMIDYPLIPSKPEPEVDYVHRAYIEALWLPESIMPLPHLVQALRRVPASSIRSVVKPLLLSLRAVETKYHEHLPSLLVDPNAVLDPNTGLEREIDPEETAMWYAWHHGKPPARHFPDGDNVDEERWKRVWMRDMERREVLVQILLHYTYIAAPRPLVTPPSKQSTETEAETERSRKRKRKSLRDDAPVVSSVKKKRGKGRKKSPSPTEDELTPEENLDMLTDRMAIWQAVEEEGEKFLKRAGDGERDWMTVFCEDVVKVLFQDDVPDLVKMFEEKLVPPSAHESSSEEEAKKPIPQPRKRKSIPTRKPTLTEADLADALRKGPGKGTNTSIHKGAKTHLNKVVERSRSISVEPEGRRSRSRSVSLAAEEIKAVGGKRGGIAGNSRLFASEVEMRRAVPVSASGSAGVSGSTGRGLKKVASSSSIGEATQTQAQDPIKPAVNPKPLKATTLVAETPPRAGMKSTLLVGDSSEDEEGVPESPEVKYVGTKLAEKILETPIKKGRRR